jgi:hypothetical protein
MEGGLYKYSMKNILRTQIFNREIPLIETASGKELYRP